MDAELHIATKGIRINGEAIGYELAVGDGKARLSFLILPEEGKCDPCRSKEKKSIFRKLTPSRTGSRN